MGLNQGGGTIEGELRVGKVSLVLFELRLCDRQICFVLVDDALIGTGINLGADLSLLYLGVVIAKSCWITPET